MARPRSADFDDQRTSILKHAISAFATHSYPSASMADLALRCGLSKAGLYHYYPTKEAILFDALNRYTHSLMQLAAEVTERFKHQPPAAQLRSLLQAFMKEYRASQDVHLVLLSGPQYLTKEQRSIIHQQERQVVYAFGQLLRRCWPEQINDHNEFALTMTLMSALNFSFAWLRTDGPLSHEQYADWIADLWLKGPQAGFSVTNPPLQSDREVG
jgi:AcrR family transcriptional regulator